MIGLMTFFIRFAIVSKIVGSNSLFDELYSFVTLVEEEDGEEEDYEQ